MRRLLLAIATILLTGVAPAPATAAPGGPMLYVTNGNSNTISIFTIEADGDLSPFGQPVPTAANPRGIVFAPGGDLAYVANSGANQISSYRVGPAGGLKLLGQVGTDEVPFGIAISPRGNAVFATSLNEDTVSAFTVRADGTLEPAGTPVPVGDGSLSTRGVAVSTDGRFVFVGTGEPMNPTPGTLSTFEVQADNTLELLSTTPVGAGALGIGVAPNGRFIYLACGASDEIRPFRLAPNGHLTPLPITKAPDLPVTAEISRDGRFLFTTVPAFDAGDPKGVWVFTIRADGTLRPVGDEPTPAGGAPAWPAITPDGRHLYVTNEDTSGLVFGFDVSAAGVLAPLAGSPFPARGEFSMFQSAAIRG